MIRKGTTHSKKQLIHNGSKGNLLDTHFSLRGSHMDEEYRGFKLYGGCEPISETLLGRVTQWKPTGCIAYKHSNGVVAELTRFRFPITLMMRMSPSALA